MPTLGELFQPNTQPAAGAPPRMAAPADLLRTVLAQIAATQPGQNRSPAEGFPSSIAQPPNAQYSAPMGPPAPAPQATTAGWDATVQPTTDSNMAVPPPGMQDPTSIGGVMGAQPAPQQDPSGFFQDPINRAALMSFGLNMMNGGWGSPAQTFAHAAGQAMETTGGLEKYGAEQANIQADNARQDEALLMGAEEKAADRGSREKIAKGYQDQRRETAGIGGNSGALTRQERQFWDRTYAAELKRLEFSGLEPDELDQTAIQRADGALAARQKRFGAGKTSPNMPGEAGPVVPDGPPEAPGKTSPNASPNPRGITPTPTPTRPLSQFSAGLSPAAKAKLEQMMQTPAGRALLQSRGYDVTK